jgi:hypothetical protein
MAYPACCVFCMPANALENARRIATLAWALAFTMAASMCSKAC